LESEIYGTTTGGWIIRQPPSMTNRAKYSFLIERGAQRSIVERGADQWRYMQKFDTSILPPSQTRNDYLLSISGVDVKKSDALQDALDNPWTQRPRAVPYTHSQESAESSCKSGEFGWLWQDS